jgi:hypothetical protein
MGQVTRADISALDEREQRIYRAFFIDDLSLSDIGAREGISRQRVAAILGGRRLRAALLGRPVPQKLRGRPRKAALLGGVLQ